MNPKLLYFVAFIDLFAASLLVPSLPSYLASLNADPLTIGWIKSIYGTLQLFTAPIAGSASDIYGRRRILLWTIAGPITGYILLGVAGSISVVIISRIPCGIFKHSLDSIKLAIADSEATNSRAVALGRLNACTSFGFILGPLLGGYISSYPNGFQYTAGLTALLFSFNFALVYVFGHEDPEKIAHVELIQLENNIPSKGTLRQMVLSKLKEYWMNLHDPTPARSMLIVRLLMAMSAVIFRSHFMLSLDTKYGADSKTRGYILSYMGFLTSCGSIGVAQFIKWVHSEAALIQGAVLILAGSYIWIGTSTALSSVLIGLIPNAIAVSILRACTISFQSKFVEKSQLGGLMGISSSLTSLARTISPVISGLLLTYHVDGPALGASVVALLSGGVFYQLIYNRMNIKAV